MGKRMFWLPTETKQLLKLHAELKQNNKVSWVVITEKMNLLFPDKQRNISAYKNKYQDLVNDNRTGTGIKPVKLLEGIDLNINKPMKFLDKNLGLYIKEGRDTFVYIGQNFVTKKFMYRAEF